MWPSANEKHFTAINTNGIEETSEMTYQHKSLEYIPLDWPVPVPRLYSPNESIWHRSPIASNLMQCERDKNTNSTTTNIEPILWKTFSCSFVPERWVATKSGISFHCFAYFTLSKFGTNEIVCDCDVYLVSQHDSHEVTLGQLSEWENGNGIFSFCLCLFPSSETRYKVSSKLIISSLCIVGEHWTMAIIHVAHAW